MFWCVHLQSVQVSIVIAFPSLQSVFVVQFAPQLPLTHCAVPKLSEMHAQEASHEPRLSLVRTFIPSHCVVVWLQYALLLVLGVSHCSAVLIIPFPQHEPQSAEHDEHVSFVSHIEFPQTLQVPQSEAQVLHVSPPLQTLSPQTGGHIPQSEAQLEQVSPLLQVLSPQNAHIPQSSWQLVHVSWPLH